MKALRRYATRLRHRLALAPEQAENSATIKSPCC